jgi:membrane protein insertase Oxa1/YidC/SpoIIIJ
MLQAQVVKMENMVIENTLSFQKSQERTNFLILKLKNTISEKDSIYVKALKKIALVEKDNRITTRKSNRNLIIFSIITCALLILAMVFYTIATKMRKQRRELMKLNMEMQTIIAKIKRDKSKMELIKGHKSN